MSSSSALGSTAFRGDVEVARATKEERAWRAGRLAALGVGLAWVALACWLAVRASWATGTAVTIVTPFVTLLAFYGVEYLARGLAFWDVPGRQRAPDGSQNAGLQRQDVEAIND